MKVRSLLIAGIVLVSISLFTACGEKEQKQQTSSTEKAEEATKQEVKAKTAPAKTEAKETEVTKEETESAKEEKTFDGLIDHLASNGFITKDGDGGSFAEAMKAVNGYRYYNLEKSETTEIYEFESEEEAANVSVNGNPITPDKVIGTYAIFSENEDLIKAIEEYLN